MFNIIGTLRNYFTRELLPDNLGSEVALHSSVSQWRPYLVVSCSEEVFCWSLLPLRNLFLVELLHCHLFCAYSVMLVSLFLQSVGSKLTFCGFLCLHEWLATEGILFLGSPWVCAWSYTITEHDILREFCQIYD